MDEAEKCSMATRRGRPVVLPPKARQKRIFEALEAVYWDCGLEGASMDAVAGRAGMSKRTIYAMFPSRAALLRSYLEQVGSGLIQTLPSGAGDLPLEERLRGLLTPESRRWSFGLPLEILRHIVSDMQAAPEVARGLLERTSDVSRRILIAELERGCARGEVEIEDVPAAAALLLDMLRPWPIESLLDQRRLPDDSALAARMELAISVFLNGTASRG